MGQKIQLLIASTFIILGIVFVLGPLQDVIQVPLEIYILIRNITSTILFLVATSAGIALLVDTFKK